MEKDWLTGLDAHKCGIIKLEELLDESEKKGQAFGIVWLDLDRFKKFNDTYGHPEGDNLLRWIAPLISGIIAEQGFVFRFAGDEFLILLPGFNRETTKNLAEELRAAIEKTTVEIDGKTFSPLTATLGLAVYPANGKDWISLIRSAEEALIYGKKRTSRNRVLFESDKSSVL